MTPSLHKLCLVEVSKLLLSFFSPASLPLLLRFSSALLAALLAARTSTSTAFCAKVELPAFLPSSFDFMAFGLNAHLEKFVKHKDELIKTIGLTMPSYVTKPSYYTLYTPL